jgi:hypothetical protein
MRSCCHGQEDITTVNKSKKPESKGLAQVDKYTQRVKSHTPSALAFRQGQPSQHLASAEDDPHSTPSQEFDADR